MATSRLTPDEVKALFSKLSNWGRWGKEDERGALNFINDKKRAAAGRLIQTGEVVSLALPLATTPGPDNPTPVTHLMTQVGHDAHEQQLLPYSGDYFAIAPHGLAPTHIHPLSHVFSDAHIYTASSATH